MKRKPRGDEGVKLSRSSGNQGLLQLKSSFGRDYAVAVIMGMLALAGMWYARPGPAAAQTAPVCAVGTTACQQALLTVDKGTGAATGKVLIPGDNTENNHNDSLECHGPSDGKCYLAIGSNGIGILETVSITSCNTTPTGNVTKIGGTGNRYNAVAIDAANGTLYGVVGTQFGSISTVSGTFTAIGSGLGGNFGDASDLILGMAWDSTAGNFLASVDQSHGNAASELIRIDPATGKVVKGAFGGKDSITVVPDNGRSQVSGIVWVGNTLYAAVSAGDVGGHLEKLDAATGGLTDIGVFGTEIPKVRSLSADAKGTLFGLTGTAGGFVQPLPCPTPTASPTPTPPPPPPPPVQVAPVQVQQTQPPPEPTPSPSTSVLGVQVNRQPTLPVTGSNALPLLLLALMCYVFGAFALKAASKPKASHAAAGSDDGADG